MSGFFKKLFGCSCCSVAEQDASEEIAAVIAVSLYLDDNQSKATTPGRFSERSGKRCGSSWNNKMYGMTQLPQRKGWR